MAFAHYSFYSNALHRITEFDISIPNDIPSSMPHISSEAYERRMKTLILLHGYSGYSSDWFISGNASDLSMMNNLAVVCPSGENSFYTDAKGTGHAFCTYIGEELPRYLALTLELSDKREDCYIGGYSMGGYGALHIGLNYNHQFSGIMALSSALIINQLKDMEPGMENEMANYDYYVSVFGDLKKAENSNLDPCWQIRQLIDRKEVIPSIYFACGAQDFLIDSNLMFRQFLEDSDVPYEFEEGDGIHDFNYWRPHAVSGINYLLNNEKEQHD